MVLGNRLHRCRRWQLCLYVRIHIFKAIPIRKGYRLSKSTGGNQEYLGTTQLSFPDYIAVDEGHSVPEPLHSLMNNSVTKMLWKNMNLLVLRLRMFKYLTFTSSSEEYLEDLEYGQWRND